MRISVITSVLLIFLLLLAMSACQITRGTSESPGKQEPSKKFSPLEKLSISLSNSLGFELARENKNVVVKSLKPDGPGGVAGLTDGMIVKSLGGISLENLSDGEREKLNGMLGVTDIPAIVIGQDGSDQEFKIHLGPENCPQRITSYFTFVETPRSGQPSTFLMISISRMIFNLTFERKAGNKIDMFNRQTGNWWYFNQLDIPFDKKANPSDLSAVLIKEFSFSSDPGMRKGSISFSGEEDFKLEFDLNDVREEPYKVLTGKGKLRIGKDEFTGFVLSRESSEKLIKPFYDERKIDLKRPLPDDSRHIEDRFIDWIILFDSQGNSLEADIEGDTKTWWGMVYPSAISRDAESCLRPIAPNAIMPELKMYWFDDVIEGKEADPYPSEVTLKSPGTLKDGLHFVGVHPDYSASDQKIMVIVEGECKAPDGSKVPFSGFLKRLVFSAS